MTAPPALVDAARVLLEANTRLGDARLSPDGRAHRFTVPSPSAYPFQWFWDSCFHAVAWCHIDAGRAREELEGLLAWQRPDGFIPHVIFWDRVKAMTATWHYLESAGWLRLPYLPTARGKPATTEMIQPPVLALAVERVHAALGDSDGSAFLARAVPALEAYHRWLFAARDPDGDGLISIIAPSESGLDFSPAYDPALGLEDPGLLSLTLRMRLTTLRNKTLGYSLPRIWRARGFAVEDVLVNAVMAQGLGALERLATAARRPEVAAWAAAQAAATTRALLAKCWDERDGLFYNLAGREERPCRVNTVVSLMPLILDGLPRDVVDRVVEEQLRSPARYGPGARARYAVPSVAASEPAYREDSALSGVERIWRGGTWLNTNWFLAHGLRRHGHDDLAASIRASSVALVEGAGFREHFNARTGEGMGARDFGWSTLVIDT